MRGRWAAYTLVWAIVVAAGSSVAWLAISRVGHEVALLGDVPVVSRPLATTVVLPGPSDPPVTPPPGTPPVSTDPPTSTRPTTRPRTSTSAPRANPSTSAVVPVEGSTTTDGGRVFAACAGTSLLFRSAQAADGWTVSTSSSTNRIEVEFRRSDRDIEVTVRCVFGAPTFTQD